jgi:hypothetical protein
MLGIVFTEFVEMVEERFSEEVLDEILEAPSLSTSGAFTSVGYYDHTDMIKMVVALSKEVNVPIDDLIAAFGEHLFGKLVAKYPTMIEGHNRLLDFLETVDTVVHKEVIKLYPHAELPRFSCNRLSDDCLEMNYQSKRPFSQLALGLINGCALYFKQPIDVVSQSSDTDASYSTTFVITTKNDG